MSEILEASLYLVEQLGYGDKIPAGFVITGGSAYLENIKSLGAAITDHCVRLANVQGNISDKSVDSSYDTTASSSIGSVLYAFDHKPSTQPLYEADTNKKESADKNGEPIPEEKPKTSLFGRFFGGKAKGETKKEAQQEEPEVIAAQTWAPAGGHDEPKQKSEPRPVPTPQKGNKKTKKNEPADDGIFGTIFGELNNEA
ncbi:MAG: hypothetical protein HUJ90_05645 [Bacteroidales bacterium]|nr:hypothetical protein [Bacteroidales bacterium]